MLVPYLSPDVIITVKDRSIAHPMTQKDKDAHVSSHKEHRTEVSSRIF
jgi:hypothetical protein